MRHLFVSTAVLWLACGPERDPAENHCPAGTVEGPLGSCNEIVKDAGPPKPIGPCGEFPCGGVDGGPGMRVCDGLVLFDGLAARWTTRTGDVGRIDVAWKTALELPPSYFEEGSIAPETDAESSAFVSSFFADPAGIAVHLTDATAFLSIPRTLVFVFPDPRALGQCVHPGMDDRHTVTITTRREDASGDVVVDATWNVDLGDI